MVGYVAGRSPGCAASRVNCNADLLIVAGVVVMIGKWFCGAVPYSRRVHRSDKVRLTRSVDEQDAEEEEEGAGKSRAIGSLSE